MDGLRDKGAQFIVADMGSTELGLREYLDGLDWVEKYYHDAPRDWINDEYHAKNAIIERIKHDTIVFLQDDSQMIVPDEHLYACIDDFQSMDDCYVMEIFGVRRVTLEKTTHRDPTLVNGRRYWKRVDQHFVTTGIFKTEIFKEVGPYPVDWETKKENWGASESWYANEVKKLKNSNTYRTHIPLFLSVWNDPRGGYAFIREDKRYGNYLDPVDSDLYYKKLNETQVESFLQGTLPMSFMNVAMPLGWQVPTVDGGEQKKWVQADVMGEGPVEQLP